MQGVNTVSTNRVIIDSGASDILVNRAWKILSSAQSPHRLQAFDGTTVMVDTIVTAAAKVRTYDGWVLLIVYDADYLPEAEESLLNPNLLRHAGHDVQDNMCSTDSCEISLRHASTIPLLTEECSKSVLYFEVETPSEEDLDRIHAVELNRDIPREERVYLKRYKQANVGKPSPEDVREWARALGTNNELTYKTLMCTTQYAQQEGHQQLQRHIKPRFPFLNVHRLRCDVYTDTFFASQKGIHGYTCAQMFYGSDGHMSVYPLKRKGQFFLAFKSGGKLGQLKTGEDCSGLLAPCPLCLATTILFGRVLQTSRLRRTHATINSM
eukprot:scaffold369_cov281-Pinguiococcus_pyrenoidosus.AAC.6